MFVVVPQVLFLMTTTYMVEIFDFAMMKWARAKAVPNLSSELEGECP